MKGKDFMMLVLPLTFCQHPCKKAFASSLDMPGQHLDMLLHLKSLHKAGHHPSYKIISMEMEWNFKIQIQEHLVY